MRIRDPEKLPYDFEVERLVEEIVRRGVSRILLQFPEGLLQYSPIIAEVLEKRSGAKVFVSGRGSYGACDIAVDEALSVGAELIVHFGHTPYTLQASWRSDSPEVVYVPARSRLELGLDLMEKTYRLLVDRGLSNPLLVASVQHVHLLSGLKEYLVEKGLSPKIPESRAGFPGQVLGCDYRVLGEAKENTDSIVLVAGGKFHLVGLLLSTELPIVHVDPYSGESRMVVGERERLLRRRYAVLSKAMDHEPWALWVGARSGQYRPWLVAALERELEKRGVSYLKIVSMDTGSYQIMNVASSGVRVHVITSCPRIPIDDVQELKDLIVLTPGEALMALRGDYGAYRFPW